MPSLGRFLIIAGLGLVVVGALLMTPAFGWLGRLPGDIRVERDNLRVYVPVTTSILVSIVLSLFFWITNRFRQ